MSRVFFFESASAADGRWGSGHDPDFNNHCFQSYVGGQKFVCYL